MVHGRTQSALSQVYACKYAHSRLNHRHSNGYSRDLLFFGVVGALLGYNSEKSEAPESDSPQSSPKEGSRWQYPRVRRAGLCEPAYGSASLGRAEKREHSPSREHRENVSYRLGKWEYDHGLGLEFRFPVSLPHTFYMRNGFVSEIRDPQKTYRVYSS